MEGLEVLTLRKQSRLTPIHARSLCEFSMRGSGLKLLMGTRLLLGFTRVVVGILGAQKTSKRIALVWIGS